MFLVFLALFAVLPTGSGTEFAKLMHFSKVLVGIDRSANGQWYRICEIRAFPKNLVGIDRSANGQQCISSEMYYSGLRRRPGSSDLNSADNSDWFSSLYSTVRDPILVNFRTFLYLQGGCGTDLRTRFGGSPVC